MYNSMIFVYIISGMLFFVGIILLVFIIPPEKETSISVFGKEVKQKERSHFSFILSSLAPLNDLLINFLGIKDIYERDLTIVKWRLTPGEFFAWKELMGLLGFFIWFFLKDFIGFINNRYFAIIFPLIFFMIPSRVLSSNVKRVKYEIVRVLPEVVELIGLCVGAGLDFFSAIKWVVDKSVPNPLLEELSIVLREINLGRPRMEALKGMSQRLMIPDISSFVRILIQADRMGTPIEETLKILSEDVRMRRFHRGERLARVAPLKMLVPLLMCVGVIMIIVAGPIILNFITGKLSVGF